MFSALATFCSVLFIYWNYGAVYAGFDGVGARCGTFAVNVALNTLLVPVLLFLPFVKLLWAKRLSLGGQIARGALTVAGATWIAAVAVLWQLDLLRL